VFNINSLTPHSRSSIIYDVNLGKREITIAQTLSPFSKNTPFKELHLTTIVRDKKKMRVGVKCIGLTVIEEYALANDSVVPAVVLTYEPLVKETNIRSAFRLPLSMRYIIKGKLLFDNREYSSPRDFSIRDISLTGLGLIIPRKRNKGANSLTKIKVNEILKMGIILINMDESKPMGTLAVTAQVVRIQSGKLDTHVEVGLKTDPLSSESETILNRFIHDAQIDELKRLSRLKS
jgi:hypothetical protein